MQFPANITLLDKLMLNLSYKGLIEHNQVCKEKTNIYPD